MRILSPAKINLTLKILGQRQDGYHLLQTYFQLLDWGDTINFELLDNHDIHISGQFGTLAQEDNLIYKALLLLLPHRKNHKGICIDVEKNIPQGSGLGGGSSNAGTTLRIVNGLWECNLSAKHLQKLALELGADVPVFVLNQSAMALGVGEKLTPYEIDQYFYVLIFPEISIATVDVFKNKHLNRHQLQITLSDINNKNQWKNACLPVVLANYPAVKEVYNIASNITTTYMSGTGSTLFCCFDSNSKANEFINRCPKHWNMQVCKSKIIQ